MTDTKPATLKTISELTGLSLSTVSLALKDGSRLKPSTKQKVAMAAKQVGYVPNRAGVRLRTGRTNVLALVLSTDSVAIDYTRSLIHGIGSSLEGSRFHLNVVPEINREDPIASVRYILENRSADGIILTHTSARDPRVLTLLDANFPFVCHGRTEFQRPHAYLDFHAESFVDMAVARLAGRGRKQAMLVAIDNQTTNHANILSSFHRATATQGIKGFLNPNPLQPADAPQARALGQTLSQSNPDCDAIVCNNELIALAVLSGLQDSGRVLGKDYDLICKQTTELLPTLYPQIDTVSEDLSNSGAELTKLMINRLGGAEISDLQALQEPVAQWRSDPVVQT